MTQEKKGGTKVTCTVAYMDASTTAKRATWRLSRGRRTVARGVTRVRKGRLAVHVARQRRLRRGRYVLTVKFAGTAIKEVIHVR